MSLFGFLGDIVGGFLGADAADDAADAQRASAQEANALQRYMYDTTRQDFAPYREAGYSALNQLQRLLNNPNNVRQLPGYQFGRNEGIRALDRSASARGMVYSGAQAKALQRFGNDYATTKMNDAYNRLANMAGLGQVGVNGSAMAGQNFANQAGNNLIGMGNAQAANSLLRGSIYQNALGSAGAAMPSFQAWASNTPWGSGGWGTGNAYGNEDMGQYL